MRETPEEYTITYDGNGNTEGYPPVDDNRYKSGEYAVVLDGDTLIKAGYKFLGWNIEPESDEPRYYAKNKIKIDNENIYLYAVWDEKPIGIEYN